jgi:hypothetical protein
MLHRQPDLNERDVVRQILERVSAPGKPGAVFLKDETLMDFPANVINASKYLNRVLHDVIALGVYDREASVIKAMENLGLAN